MREPDKLARDGGKGERKVGVADEFKNPDVEGIVPLRIPEAEDAAGSASRGVEDNIDIPKVFRLGG